MLTFNEIYTFVKTNGTGNKFGKACLHTINGDYPIKTIKTLGANKEIWIISTNDQAVKVSEEDTLITIV